MKPEFFLLLLLLFHIKNVLIIGNIKYGVCIFGKLFLTPKPTRFQTGQFF